MGIGSPSIEVDDEPENGVDYLNPTWKKVKSIIEAPEIPYVSKKSSLLERFSKADMDQMLDSCVKEEIKRLWENQESVNEEVRKRNREQVNTFQQKSMIPSLENIIGYDYLSECERLKDKRFLNFYIRSSNIPRDYRLLIEIIFHFASRYKDRSRLFNDFRIIPRCLTDRFSKFITTEKVLFVEDEDFKRASICSANTIHFSHGLSMEGAEGARPMICRDIELSMENNQGNKNQNDGRFTSLTSFNNSIYLEEDRYKNLDIPNRLDSFLRNFLKDLQRFEEEIIAEAKAYLEKHQKEIEEVGNSQ